MTSNRSGVEGALRDVIHRASFVPDAPTRRVGVEVELLVHDEAGFPVPLLGGRRNLVSVLRSYASRAGWREVVGYGDVPRFVVPGKGIVSFEPGGQLEISSEPSETVSELVAGVQSVVERLMAVLSDEGIRLESMGIDPVNDARAIALQLPVERYQMMTRYLDRRGPYGARMMRQTAAVQVSLDRGETPAARWQLLNDLAPYAVAIFANSPHYVGQETGHRSYRAHCWRMLDVTRTGVCVPSADPARAYARFALAANDIALSADGIDRPYSSRGGAAAEASAWQSHLTTLFPEVRPRGHFEIRSCDSIAARWYAAPVVLFAGLVYDERSARDATVLTADSRALLRGAGERGLRDPSIARTARDLFQLALDGARRLGERYCGGAELEAAADFFATYTARDRSPADDRLMPAPSNGRLSVVAP